MENKEDQGIAKNIFARGKKLGLVVRVILCIGLMSNVVAADLGGLQINNILGLEIDSNKVYLQHTSDGNPDHPWLDVPAGSNICSEDLGLNRWYTHSEASGYSPFDIKLLYTGTTSQQTNNLELRFPYAEYTFGIKPITMQLENGQRYNVRKAIEDGEGVGIIPLEDLPAGSYTSASPYANLELHFRHLADLNNSGTVDLVDFSMLSNNWLGSGLGDISGPDSLPDGIVDIYDLLKMVDQWLEETSP